MTDTREPSPVWRQQHRLDSCTRPSRAHSASSASSYASDADSASFSGSNDDASPVSVQTSVTSHVGSPASGKARYASDAGPPLLEEPAAKKCRLDSGAACVRDGGDAPAPKPDEVDANTTARLNRALYVENLVDAAVVTISSIWGRFSRESRGQEGAGSALPLDTFVREILRRSRTSCSTLQAALLYCDRCRDVVQSSVDRSLQTDEHRDEAGSPESQSRESSSMPDSDTGSTSSTSSSLPSLSPPSAYFYAARSSQGSEKSQLNGSLCSASPLLCGRRMFLAAIMVASKFLQDRTYSNRAWSKISGLPTRELEQLERVFLHSIQYNLVVDLSEWSQWIRELVTLRATMAAVKQQQQPQQPAASVRAVRNQGLRRATSENVLGQAVPYDVAIGQKRDAGPQEHAVARINFVRNGSYDGARGPTRGKSLLHAP